MKVKHYLFFGTIIMLGTYLTDQLVTHKIDAMITGNWQVSTLNHPFVFFVTSFTIFVIFDYLIINHHLDFIFQKKKKKSNY